MNVAVLMSSGETDTWVGVDEPTVVEERMMTLLVTKNGAKVAQYAPGMWMKVEYDVEVGG